MLYLNICICEIIFLFWSYYFVKTYQLDGYNIKAFLNHAVEFKLSFGNKNKLIFTKRMIRFIFTLFVFSTAIFTLILLFSHNPLIKALDCIVVYVFASILISICHYINLPIEIIIKKFYISKARKKLVRLNPIKIGITGSFGKTSTKNILCSILEKEYKVLTTPKNYNTLMGITKTILKDLDDHDIFIAEMGAKHKGDIEVLTKFVKPKYGIITSIGAMHLDTFKNLKNIEETKNELPLNLDKDGVMIFNGNSIISKKLYDKFLGNKFLTGIKGSFAYAENINVSANGSSFDLIIDNKILKAKTKLLGKFNIDNIVTASALAYILGISLKDIEDAILKLSTTPHRLEIIKNNYCTILDDAYNSNEIGFTQALEVLDKFNGIKIVVTPGLVEMGSKQSEVNFLLGGKIADVADYIIIMNEVNKNYLLSGAISHNFPRDKIYFANNRKKQKEILEKLIMQGCVILFENDLPDNFM